MIWEYNIPVPIKYISEPDMHSMPATTLHPSGGFFVGQSLDNKIVTWTARDKFRQIRKKEFKGHVNAGYACRMAFSPNGKFLASGDGQGKMYIWDWGSSKVYRKLQVGESARCFFPRVPVRDRGRVASCVARWRCHACCFSVCFGIGDLSIGVFFALLAWRGSAL